MAKTPASSPPESCARLRILASSDIHGHIRSHDYRRDCPVTSWGFARLASLIDQARQEEPCNIMLDNGDFLQGTALCDLYSDPSQLDAPHPVIACFQAMGYDAIGLGNHEFNFGPDLLHHLADQSDIPILCANALTQKGDTAAKDVAFLPPRTRLTRHLTDPATGESHPLRIGVFSVLPPQITKWDGAHLNGRITARDMVETAAFQVAQLRQEGADIIVALVHSGIEARNGLYEAENAALDVAALPGIDAIVTGHTHRVFPDPAHAAGGGVDPHRGQLHGVPAVMPGFRGSHLGVLDLDLRFADGAWAVVARHSAVRAVLDPVTQSAVPEHPSIIAASRTAHDRTLAHIKAPLGQSHRPIQSYFSLVRCDLPLRLVAAAQAEAVRRALAHSPYADLPLLSATAPYQTGGRAGPWNYCDIPAGILTQRSASDLYPFPNTLCAVRVTGGQLRNWLERAVSCFRQIRPGQGPQPLLNPNFPGHAVDTLDGLTYRIDLTAPPGFDHKGQALSPAVPPRRIQELRHKGRPVQLDHEFIVALNNYRAFGGGPYAPFTASQIVLASDILVRDALIDFIKADGANTVPDTPVWSFADVPGAAGLFETGPGAMAGGDSPFISHGLTEDGFVSMCLPLAAGTCESAA